MLPSPRREGIENGAGINLRQTMKFLTCWSKRQISHSLMVLLIAPSAEALTTPLQREDRVGARVVIAAEHRSQIVSRDDCNTGAERSAHPSCPERQQQWAQVADHSQEATGPQNSQTKHDDSAPAPGGTAVAPYEKPGVAASRPAGAAIAPAKQRRVRSFTIRIAILAGAAVAVGVVAAASLGSPSRPH